MRIGTMFGDIFRSFFQRPATRSYPAVRREPPPRFRGKLSWDPGRCTGCGLCAKDCPSNAIEVIVIDRAKKQFAMRYQVDRCTFCAQCVQNCRFKCISMSQGAWELASLSKDPFTVFFGDSSQIRSLLAGAPAAEPEAPA